MRKALKLCLALVMAGSMAAGTALAGDTQVTASGEAYWYFTNSSKDVADASGDKIKQSSMDMDADGGVYLDAVNKGDAWTTSASVGLYFYADGSVEADHINLKIANDQFGLQFGTSDLGGAEKNPSYYLGAKIDAGDELSKGGAYTVFTMPEVGLGVLYGANYDSDNKYQKTAIAVSFDKVFGDIDFSFEYEMFSTAIDEKVGGKDGEYDGAASSDMGIGVAYNMDPLAIKFSYDSKSEKDGGKNSDGDSYKGTATSQMMLGVDYKLDDMSGVSAVYQSILANDKDGELKTTTTK
jgi:hypothetical protein